MLRINTTADIPLELSSIASYGNAKKTEGQRLSSRRGKQFLAMICRCLEIKRFVVLTLHWRICEGRHIEFRVFCYRSWSVADNVVNGHG